MMIENATGYWCKVVGAPTKGYDEGSLEWSFDVALTGATIAGEDAVSHLKGAGLGTRVKNKGDEKGDFLHLKRNAVKKDGDPSKPIAIVDSAGKAWDDRKIGNGSKLNVKVLVQEYGDTKKPKLTLKPMAIQVWDYVPYEGGASFPTKEVTSTPESDSPEW